MADIKHHTVIIYNLYQPLGVCFLCGDSKSCSDLSNLGLRKVLFEEVFKALLLGTSTPGVVSPMASQSVQDIFDNSPHRVLTQLKPFLKAAELEDSFCKLNLGTSTSRRRHPPEAIVDEPWRGKVRGEAIGPNASGRHLSTLAYCIDRAP
jgi:hypothetical protein